MTCCTASWGASRMPTSYEPGDGGFFDKDYFERGPASGKGLYTDFHWMPRRSIPEALAVIDTLALADDARVLDVGCAKGYFVYAMRTLGVQCHGCDISAYAIDNAHPGLPNGALWLATPWAWDHQRDCQRYTDAFSKDTLEHCSEAGLQVLLRRIARVASTFMCVVPLGDGNGRYVIQCYEDDASHVLRLTAPEWRDRFQEAGWRMVAQRYHVQGIKDNWYDADPHGNMVYVLKHS